MSDGDPRFVLLDEAGDIRAEMAILQGEPGVAILDRNRTVRAELFISDGAARLALRDPAGTDRAVIGAIETIDHYSGTASTAAESTMTLFDGDGFLRYQVDEFAPLALWDY